MPVVIRDMAVPTDWFRASAGIGVIRDGDRLRIAFRTRAGAVESGEADRSEWNSGCPLRTRVEREVARGVPLTAGLEPFRCLVRTLESPFSDLEKSAEIWPSLLDAALPFPLEDCQVAFLPPEPAGSGVRCVAAAARGTDLEEALGEWREWELEPDFLVPEPLLLSEEPVCRIWRGRERMVCTAWSEGRFLGAAGARGPAQREKVLARFRNVWSREQPELEWRESGPDSGAEPAFLEEAAAAFPLRMSDRMVNLRGGEWTSPAVSKRFAKCRRCLVAGVGLLLLLFVLAPLGVRLMLRNEGRRVREQTGEVYTALTGRTGLVPPVASIRQQVESSADGLRRAAEEVVDPGVTRMASRMLKELRQRNLETIRLQADTGHVLAEVLGPEEALRNLQGVWRRDGYEAELASGEKGNWRLEVSAR